MDTTAIEFEINLNFFTGDIDAFEDKLEKFYTLIPEDDQIVSVDIACNLDAQKFKALIIVADNDEPENTILVLTAHIIQNALEESGLAQPGHVIFNQKLLLH